MPVQLACHAGGEWGTTTQAHCHQALVNKGMRVWAENAFLRTNPCVPTCQATAARGVHKSNLPWVRSRFLGLLGGSGNLHLALRPQLCPLPGVVPTLLQRHLWACAARHAFWCEGAHISVYPGSEGPLGREGWAGAWASTGTVEAQFMHACVERQASTGQCMLVLSREPGPALWPPPLHPHPIPLPPSPCLPTASTCVSPSGAYQVLTPAFPEPHTHMSSPC